MALEPFCKLRNPDGYIRCDWDLHTDAVGREAWINIFADHTTSLLQHARESDQPPLEEAIDAYELAFHRVLERIRLRPEEFSPLDIYELCDIRARLMREYGIGDPYDKVKRAESEAALGNLPAVLAAVDTCAPDAVVETLLRAILAGNKFDLGAKDTTDLHRQGGIDFFKTLAELPPRPWFADDLDRVKEKLAPGQVAYRKAIFFVDNAGGDVVLGAIPMARYLADQGCRVVFAANDEPSLNDITVWELHDVLAAAAGYHDPGLVDHLRTGAISVVGTGCDCPLIDLGQVSQECNHAAADADLVILEGMGRAVESNYETRFTCDTLHLAMIKNRKLAKWMGCQLFDLIVRFKPV